MLALGTIFTIETCGQEKCTCRKNLKGLQSLNCKARTILKFFKSL